MRATVLLLLFACLSVFPPLPAPAAAAYDCEGNACQAVTLTWDDEKEKFRAANSGARAARVEAYNWLGGCSVLVQPRAAEYLTIKNFDGPYHANFE